MVESGDTAILDDDAASSSIDGEIGVSFSLLLLEVHHQLICYADVEMEVVRVLTSSLVGLLIIVGDQANDG